MKNNENNSKNNKPTKNPFHHKMKNSYSKNSKMSDNEDISAMDIDHRKHSSKTPSKYRNHGKDSHMKMGKTNHDMMDMENLKQRFWISVLLTIPIIIFSQMMGIQLPFQIQFPGSDWLVLIIGTILYFYGGQPFFTGAKGELKNKKPAMMTLITMGISVAYFYSVFSVIANNIFHLEPMVFDFFWELATLIDIMLLGHILEMSSIMSAGSALDNLAKLLPKKAHKIENRKIIDIEVSKLVEGDKIQVRSGEKIPADGKIIKGETSVDESLVTGESKQIAKKENDAVIGGSINGERTFEMSITGSGKNSYLAQVQKLVSDAQQEQSHREDIGDRIARLLFYVALILGISSFIIWFGLQGITVAFSVAVTVLVIACPHALGLAIPLVVSRSTSIGANNGLLFRNRVAIEQVKSLKYALIDKTGTLTEGNFKVTAYKTLQNSENKKNKNKKSDEDILKICASLEKGSSHPLAVGILKKSKELNLSYLKANNIHQRTGIGIAGEINGIKYDIVSSSYLDKKNIEYDRENFKKFASKGSTISYLMENEEIIGFIAQGDEIKPEAKYMIDSFKKEGIIPVLITGDNEGTAKVVGDKLDIKNIHAKLLPQDKEKLVIDYQKTGKVMMIGDGVNDAPSIVRADVGVAIGSGTDVAIDSADVILVKSNPKDVVKLLELAKKTTRKMTENLIWGAGYNVIALPLAAGIFAPFGFMLNPMIGAILMSASTIIVAINSMLLKSKNK